MVKVGPEKLEIIFKNQDADIGRIVREFLRMSDRNSVIAIFWKKKILIEK